MSTEVHLQDAPAKSQDVGDVLPGVPKSFTFDDKEFVNPNFSVDNFVKVHRKSASLEQLREDLSSYLRILRLSMTDLINQDYTDFVNLSTNLVGLDKSLNNLSNPLKLMQTEAAHIEDQFKIVIDAFNDKLETLKSIRRNKKQLAKMISVMRGLETLDKLINESNYFLFDNQEPNSFVSLERSALLLNKIRVDIKFLDENIPLVSSQLKHRLSDVTNVITNRLEENFIYAVNNDNGQLLQSVLNIYSLNGDYSELELLFRKRIVGPHMTEVICEAFLDKYGVQQLFEEILKFVETRCQVLMEKQKNTNFDFMLNSVWQEVASCLVVSTPSIFSPGNPDYFHFQYSATFDFVEKFKVLCDLNDDPLKASSCYKELVRKFNLDIYFHIRLQQITAKLEQSLNEFHQFIDFESEFKLFLTQTLFECLTSCWCTKSVFIPHLFDSFWKLTLQLLDRYSNWLQYLKMSDLILPNLANGAVDGDSRYSQIQILCLLVDECELLIDKLRQHYNNHIIYLRPAHVEANQLNESLNEAINLIKTNGIKNVINLIKLCLVSQCDLILKQVNDVPRLYRKTNRDVPLRPSNYVSSCIDLLSSFECGELSSWKKVCIRDVLEEVIQRYKAVTSEVLTSVQKIEDSLKRLKKAKGNVQQKNNQSKSDDDKIRLQLVIDIESFDKLLEEKLKLSKEPIKALDELREMATCTKNLLN